MQHNDGVDRQSARMAIEMAIERARTKGERDAWQTLKKESRLRFRWQDEAFTLAGDLASLLASGADLKSGLERVLEAQYRRAQGFLVEDGFEVIEEPADLPRLAILSGGKSVAQREVAATDC